MSDEEFYNLCGDLLGVEHQYVSPVRKTRWSSRNPGNGLYPSHGVIRCWGSLIYVCLYDPKIVKIFDDKQSVIEYIRSLIV